MAGGTKEEKGHFRPKKRSVWKEKRDKIVDEEEERSIGGGKRHKKD